MDSHNRRPGTCGKCAGSGEYRWGAVVNGRAAHGGTCFACGGRGKQTQVDIRRNRTYARHLLAKAK